MAIFHPGVNKDESFCESLRLSSYALDKHAGKRQAT
jgi:hypothetical protein